MGPVTLLAPVGVNGISLTLYSLKPLEENAMQKDNHKTRKFPFGNEGPPNKKQRPTVELRREPEEVEGYIPPISLSFLAAMRSRGINRMNPLMIALLLYREKTLADKRAKKAARNETEWLRIGPQRRRDLGISPEAHNNALNKLEAAGIIELAHDAQTKKLMAKMLIDATPGKLSIRLDANGNPTHEY